MNIYELGKRVSCRDAGNAESLFCDGKLNFISEYPSLRSLRSLREKY